MTKDYQNLRNLNLLLKSGQERKRLTEQLQEIVSDVLDEIAEHLDEGDEAVLGNRLYEVVDLESNIGTWRTVILRDKSVEAFGYGFAAFHPTVSPGGRFHLHGDINANFATVGREDWLFTANNLPQIIAAFQAETNTAIEALRASFERMKTLASAEVKEEKR